MKFGNFVKSSALSLLASAGLLAAPEAWLVEMPSSHGQFLLKALEEDPAKYQEILGKVESGINGTTLIEHERIVLGAEKGKLHEPFVSTGGPQNGGVGVGSRYIELRSEVPSRIVTVARGEEGETIEIKVAAPLGRIFYPTFHTTKGPKTMQFLFERDLEAESDFAELPGEFRVEQDAPSKGSTSVWKTVSSEGLQSGSLNFGYQMFQVHQPSELWVVKERSGVDISGYNGNKGKFALSSKVNLFIPHKGFMLAKIQATGVAGEEVSEKLTVKMMQQNDFEKFDDVVLEGDYNWTLSIK